MRTHIEAWLWAWAVILRHPGRTQLKPEKSSLGTDLEAGQQGEDPFQVHGQRVRTLSNPQREATYSCGARPGPLTWLQKAKDL